MIWLLSWLSYFEQINQNSETIFFVFRQPKTLAKVKIIPQYKHEAPKNHSNGKNRKTRSTRWRRILKEIPWVIWLDWYTAYGSWKTRRKIFWLNSILICRQTQKGHWDEQGVQGKTHTKRQRICLQPKLTNASPPGRWSKFWAECNAKVWNHYKTAVFQVCKSHICTEKTQRVFTSICRSQENQRCDYRWPYE